jgi:hypothetical protein
LNTFGQYCKSIDLLNTLVKINISISPTIFSILFGIWSRLGTLFGKIILIAILTLYSVIDIYSPSRASKYIYSGISKKFAFRDFGKKVYWRISIFSNISKTYMLFFFFKSRVNTILEVLFRVYFARNYKVFSFVILATFSLYISLLARLIALTLTYFVYCNSSKFNSISYRFYYL